MPKNNYNLIKTDNINQTHLNTCNTTCIDILRKDIKFIIFHFIFQPGCFQYLHKKCCRNSRLSSESHSNIKRATIWPAVPGLDISGLNNYAKS